jgi:nucleotide-binding universal stress UspA family protein
MAIRDILLQLTSYPEPTPSWSIDSAVYIAERLGAKLSIGLCEVHLPDVSNFFSQLLVRSRDVIEAENKKSAHNAHQLRQKFNATVSLEHAGETIVLDCPALATPWQLAARARLYDLSIVPMYGHAETRSIAEGLIFESGRPVLLLPSEGMAGHRFDEVVMGWDGSRAAARAMAEALSLCEQATSVIVATVVREKDLGETAPAADVVRHLARHGIDAKTAEVPLAEGNAGDALSAYCHQSGTDLLVMGAYGHVRAREFVLGGATRSVLQKPGLPIFMAH